MQTAEVVARQLLATLPLLSRIMAVELRQEAGEETTLPQFRVLAYLRDGPLTVSALARKRRVSLQSAGELVQSLVERGWVARTPDPSDRRQFLLELTDEGRLRYERAHQRMMERLVPLLERVTDEEMAAIQRALSALGRVLADAGDEPDDNR